MIIIGSLIKKTNPKEDTLIRWHTQVGGITTNLKFKIDFTLPKISATRIVMWKCHVDDSTKSRYDMILGGYKLSDLVLNLKISDHIIESDDETLKGSTSPMADMGTYEFKN